MTNATTQPSHSPLWDDNTAQQYVDQWGEHAMHFEVPRWSKADKSARVLDIGCGSGTVVRVMAKHLEQGEVIGVDPVKRMIDIARDFDHSDTGAVTVGYHQSAAEQLPLSDSSIDLVLAINSLHHWLDVPAGLEEVKRVCAAGARLLVVEEIWDELPEEHRPQCDDKDEAAHLSDFKSQEQILAALQQAGFEEVEHYADRSAEYAVNVFTATVA